MCGVSPAPDTLGLVPLGLRVCLTGSIALLGLVASSVGQDTHTDFAVESRLLDRDLELYAQARQRENEAVRQFRSLAQRVDEALVDPNVALATLRDLEARLSAARETAYLRSKETGAARLRIYERMERLVQLAQAVERSDPASLIEPGGPGGLWQIALEPLDVHGLMKLVVEGQLVNGSYRMSNGNRGSLRGIWSGGVLELQVIHVDQGPVGTLEGELDDDTTLRGRWNAMELGAGEAASGSWRAYLVTEDQSLDLGG